MAARAPRDPCAYAPFELGGADYGHTLDTRWTHVGHTMDTTMDTRWTLWKHGILCAARKQIMAELNKCLRWHTFPRVFAVSIECPSLCPSCVRRGSIVVSVVAWSQVGRQELLCRCPCRWEQSGKANLSLQLAVSRYVLMSVPMGAERTGELKSQPGRQTLLCVGMCVCE